MCDTQHLLDKSLLAATRAEQKNDSGWCTGDYNNQEGREQKCDFFQVLQRYFWLLQSFLAGIKQD